uniref:ORF1 n=1 Tax=uncultured densovirus TaxID=748192 RepID=A0A7L7YQQ4_9VIRU|nr:ORF1 [uncultured densovirus]
MARAFESIEEIFEESTNKLSAGSVFKRWRIQNPGLIESAEQIIRRRVVNSRARADIDLAELGEAGVAESTPLLEGAAVVGGGGAVAGGAAATSVGTGSGAIVGVGAAAAVIGTALGLGLSGGATLPGHKYIGPGNEEDLGEPVDVDDAIARKHDINYGKAKTQEDVVEADEEAISEFYDDWKKTGNIHSVIGSVGLGIKKAVEGKTGVLYPRNLPSKYGCPA